MTSLLSPPSSFSLLGVSTCSSASSSVNQPKLNVPSALGAPKSKVFSQPPRITVRLSSTTTLPPLSFHLPARKHLTSSARTHLLLTTDHGGALKRLDMDLEDRERNQLHFEDSSYRNLLSRCRGTWHPLPFLLIVRPTWLAATPVFPLLLASTPLMRGLPPLMVVIVIIIMRERRLPHLLSGQALMLFKSKAVV